MKYAIKLTAYLLLFLIIIPMCVGLFIYYLSKLLKAISHLFLFDFDCFIAELSDWDIETSLKQLK